MTLPLPAEKSSRRPAVRGAGAVAFVAAAVVVGLAGFKPAPAYRDGPPPGFTGGFGEQSCHACHFEAELNDPEGRLFLDGAPESYAAGRTYPLRVRLTRPGMSLAGFQLAVRFAEGGGQAGSLRIGPEDPERVSIAIDREINYAYQRHAGSSVADSSVASWVLLWTAPTSDRPVVFNISANAADGDDTVSGDYVYTAQLGAAGQ